MTRLKNQSILVFTCWLLSVASSKSSRMKRNLSEGVKVYKNGVIYTVDTTENWDKEPKQAFVIDENTGKLLYVGNNAGAKKYITNDQTTVIDLHKSVVLPGFHDIHMHPIEAMSDMDNHCLLPSNKRPDNPEFIEELEFCSTKATEYKWILGGGHSITETLDYISGNEEESPRYLLDEYFPDKPAVMLEETSHSAWANSLALQIAGINSSTPERPGGVIMRENGTNIPNGILFENEAMAIIALAKDPATNPMINTLNIQGLKDGLFEMSKNGITSFCDARLFWKIDQHKAYDKVCVEQDLTARTVLDMWAYPKEKDGYQIQALEDLYSAGNSECFLRRTQIKVYMDGILESTTAAMFEPFKINLSLPIISEENVGINYFDKQRLEKYINALQDFGDGHGYDFNIHAIGDRGIREALDAIEAAQTTLISRRPRHRITHVETLSRSDVNRFKELGVIADFQTAGDFTLPSHHARVAEYIGMEKASFSIPVKSVVETGAVATLSSDWDVSYLNPFVGIQHATQRGNQSINVKTAIEMYTVKAAYAMRQEDAVGSLKPGMAADLVIIDKDILKINPQDINSTTVLETVFMGESVYKANISHSEGGTNDVNSVHGSVIPIGVVLITFITRCFTLEEVIGITL